MCANHATPIPLVSFENDRKQLRIARKNEGLLPPKRLISVLMKHDEIWRTK
jgi:hypothetical protein